jgi:cation diffusion facilitator CzcD-associated flavoprotein CzcO
VIDALVIGAGPAGLAASQQLRARGIEHLVLERGTVGDSWSRVYDSLTLHTGKHMSALPGLRFPRRAPLFLPKDAFIEYLQHYRGVFGLPIEAECNVGAMRRQGDAWSVATSRGEMKARSVVVATGIMSNPRVPEFEGLSDFAGGTRHSISYRNPEPFRGKRVLVIGAGNSAGEIASELGRAGIDTTVAVRTGANVVPLQILGVPIQYWSVMVRKLPRKAQEAIVAVIRKASGPPVIPRPPYSALDSIPMIGFRLVEAIRAGQVKLRRGISHFTRDGCHFEDGAEERFDEVIFATGFRAALQFASPLVNVDARGFAVRSDRVTSADHPNLFFVGHNYDSAGGLYNIRRDAPLAAEGVAAALR